MTGTNKHSIQLQSSGNADTRLTEAPRGLPGDAIRSGRASRFLARLDGHLPIIPDRSARRAILERQLEGWERRYARFIATEGASEHVVDPADPPQAADFLLTIVGLAARRSALARDGR